MRSVAIRAHPLVFGTVVFLASESMLFAGLLAAYYFLRGWVQPWPPAGITVDAGTMAFGTALLGFGSVTMAIAQASAMRGGRLVARAMLIVTDVLALAFIGLELHDYHDADFGVGTNAYGTIYYVLTGTHLAHVAAGIVLMSAVAIFLGKPAFTRDDHAGVEAVAYYWHFVFVVWLALYATIFLVK